MSTRTVSSSSSSTKSLGTVTVLGRLRATRGVVGFAVLCLLAIVVVVLEARSVREDVAAGSIGFDAVRNVDQVPILLGIEPRWPDLQVNDRLLAVNGEPITTDQFFRTRASWPIGPIHIRVDRAGKVLELDGEVRTQTVPARLGLVARWLAGTLVLLLGAGVFLLRPGVKITWLFFAFSYALGMLVVLTATFPLPMRILLPMICAGFVFAPSLAFTFFSHFPTELRTRRLAPFLVAAAAAFWLYNLLRGTVLDTGVRVFLGVTSLASFGLLIAQWWKTRTSNDPRLASICRTLLVSSIFGLVGPSVANVTVGVLHLDGGIAHQVSAAFVATFSFFIAFLLVRHNAMDIDRYAASVIGYVATLGGLGGVFALGVLALPTVLQAFGLASSSEALVTVTAITFISVGPAYRRLRRSVDRWFSREQADAMQTAAVIRRIAEMVQSESRENALKGIVAAAKTINPEGVQLWQVENSGRFIEASPLCDPAPPHTSIAREGPFAPVLDKSGGVAGLAPTPFPTETQEALWTINLAMSAPVRAHGVRVGFLGVGRRPSGFGYRQEDLVFLETLASQAGLALERGDVVTQIGRYRVERRLAAGGTAEVFVAWQLGPGGFERKVALKRLLPELAEDPRAAASLLDEARITARLQHRNIAQVFEVGLDAGQHFIAMEFVEGPPLRSLIATQNRLHMLTPLPVALAIARELLSALEHAHTLKDSSGASLQVVHRDVTPANVLVSLGGETKLVDFGLVQATTRLFRTETGVTRGTLPYMSPEQARHDPMDARADVFSAGATLYELFTGGRAFRQGYTEGVVPELPSSVRPDLPVAFDAVFSTAYASALSARYQSANSFWAALSAAAGSVAPAHPLDVAQWVRTLSDAMASNSSLTPTTPKTTDETASVDLVRKPT